MSSIYHYTTPQGLLGIIRNQTLWCTHTRYLNDSTENTYAIAKFNELCQNYPQQLCEIAKSDEAFKAKLATFGDIHIILDCIKQVYYQLNKYMNTNLRDSYVSCFTFKKDDTTHWLSYGQSSVNYAIEFDHMDIEFGANSCGREPDTNSKYSSDKLIGLPRNNEKVPGENILRHFVPMARQVTYDTHLIENLLAPESFLKIGDQRKINIEQNISSIFNNLISFFSSIKNSEWAGEEEYRLILSEKMNAVTGTNTLKTIEGKSDIVKWRERDGILIPYIEYPINPKIIKRVIYHSKDNDSYIKQSLNLLKRIYELDFEIEKSQSSYYRM